MKLSLVVVILTYNEAIHIERAIKNVAGWADKVIILDSYSEDATVEKATSLNTECILRKFDNYRDQRQYAIDYVKDKAEWLLFLDADEYLTEELKNEIKQAIKKKDSSGYYLSRRAIFMHRWIKWGGYYPAYLLRLFKPEHARMIDRVINEHILVVGNVRYLKNDFIDHNLKNIGFWIDKHNRYAHYEAINLMQFKQNKQFFIENKISFITNRKEWLRYKLWNRLPVIIRPFLYFVYRYFFRLGFLDGKEGFIYHFLQGLWFWFIVDVKYLEQKKNLYKAIDTIDNAECTDKLY